MSRTFIIQTLDQRDRLKQFIDRRDLPFQLDIGEIREQRTTSQNARLWKLHTLAGNHVGMGPDEMHEEALCRHFGYTEVRMPTGWIKRIPLKRSSTREKQEFREFMDATETWYASEFGIWLGQEEAA